MIFPFESLSGLYREFGFVVAVLIGICFGFVLERAGFGRATKLAAQFYFYDMTVFKVMFSAIVTAMLGVVVAGGLGLVEIGHLSQLVVSGTFLWPMIFGGLLLGVGFIVSGYCPGTSLVASASGNVDGILAFVGVIVGSVLVGEVYPWVSTFYMSGDLGQVFLYDLLGVSPALLAVGVVVMAVGCFVGAEIVEKYVTGRLLGREPAMLDPEPRRFAFTLFGFASLAAVVLLVVPVGRNQAQAEASSATAQTVDVRELAHRVLDEPWMVRIIDFRAPEAFLASRIPGSENAQLDTVDELGLQYSRGVKELVLVGAGELTPDTLPSAVRAYPGRVLVLAGGFDAWQQFALTPPSPPPVGASDGDFAHYRFQAAVHAAVTGVKAPPPPKQTTKFKAPPKRKGGGCS